MSIPGFISSYSWECRLSLCFRCWWCAEVLLLLVWSLSYLTSVAYCWFTGSELFIAESSLSFRCYWVSFSQENWELILATYNWLLFFQEIHPTVWAVYVFSRYETSLSEQRYFLGIIAHLTPPLPLKFERNSFDRSTLKFLNFYHYDSGKQRLHDWFGTCINMFRRMYSHEMVKRKIYLCRDAY